MNYITLISDWHSCEPYLSMLKGRIYSRLSDVIIMDITHEIEMRNINQTAFLLRCTYPSFPEGTIHLILTGISYSLPSNPVVVQCGNHYFIGEDSGIFSLLFYDQENIKMVRQYQGNETNFLEKMVSLLASCVQGNVEERTIPYEYIRKLPFTAEYLPNKKMIVGHVLYIDSQNNILTNIPTDLFMRYVKIEKFSASVGNLTVSHFHSTYQNDSEPYFIPNSLGVMEITIFAGRISILSKWQKDSSIEIYC